ncbi:hypothetical protein H4R18_005089 [Coemansia javaensis]|uniref:Diphthamide biosynthesis protein 4 n=1 Tax=Coemansia javaensis TaxID=2761396 RepID=A0A9W8H7J1_9FUNG|nr:hypothetical protein H4R18_005089 [Coemansia javaensis]
MEGAPDYYAVLGVAPMATHEEIRRAYHALSRKIHPDRQPAPSGAAAAATEFHRIGAAWEVLGDRARRRAYDEQRSACRRRQRGVVQEEVSLDDMDYNEALRTYTYACRCSGHYSIAEADLERGCEIAPCGDCSLKICVLYDVVDDDDDGAADGGAKAP